MNTDKNNSLIYRPVLKRLASLLVVVTGLAGHALAQGTIAFNNLANVNSSPYAHSGEGGLAFLGSPSGFALLNQDINFELEAGRELGSLQPIYTWLLGDGSAKGIAVGGGYFADPSGGTYAIPGVPAGGDAIVEVRAWLGNYDNFADAIVANTPSGSVIFQNPTGGGGAPPASLVNMGALVVWSSIPEPAPVVLFMAGAGALLAWSRRRV